MCASAVVILDTPCSEVVWRVLSTHSIRQFPLQFPTRASPCAITFQMDSSNAGTPCSEVVWRVLATHSIRQLHFHFPSRASPCAIAIQLDFSARCVILKNFCIFSFRRVYINIYIYIYIFLTILRASNFRPKTAEVRFTYRLIHVGFTVDRVALGLWICLTWF
jgi:hypothetical protein